MIVRYLQKVKDHCFESVHQHQYQGGVIMKPMTEMYTKMQSMLKDEKGQTMVEYALLLVLIALVVALAIPTVTNAISTAYDNIATALG